MKFEWVNKTGNVSGPIVHVAYGTGKSRPLYVGMSNCLIARLAQHASGQQRKPWYCDIERVVITCFDASDQAAEAERRLIRALDPVHNFVRYLEVS